MADNLQDWSRYRNLSRQTKEQLEPSQEFSKSKMIDTIYRVQDKVVNEARQSRDASKIKEAERFAMALEREHRFIKYSK